MIPATRCSCAINVLKKQGRRDPESLCIFFFFKSFQKRPVTEAHIRVVAATDRVPCMKLVRVVDTDAKYPAV
jgi:hypothetical protein